VFVSGQSTVTQTGGYAGVYERYPVEGRFVLVFDADAGIALFDDVDAYVSAQSPFFSTCRLEGIFHMTQLRGTIVNETTIEFKGTISGGANAEVTAKLLRSDKGVHLTGTTIPPIGNDFFCFALDAVAAGTCSRDTGGCQGSGKPSLGGCCERGL